MKLPQKQIDKFMKILDDKLSDKEKLLFGEPDPYHQIKTFKEYGVFLAQVGEENFEKVARQIAITMRLYNSAQEDRLIGNLDRKRISRAIKKAKALKESIEPNRKYDYIEYTKVHQLEKLLDEFIDDLTNIDSNTKSDFFPIGFFNKPARKVKTPLRNLFEKICKKYNIKGCVSKAKKLVSKLE